MRFALRSNVQCFTDNTTFYYYAITRVRTIATLWINNVLYLKWQITQYFTMLHKKNIICALQNTIAFINCCNYFPHKIAFIAVKRLNIN